MCPYSSLFRRLFRNSYKAPLLVGVLHVTQNSIRNEYAFS
jgi:hypothetical protein